MVLLVAAVELQQLNGILTEADVVVRQLGQERFPQMDAVKLALFGLGKALTRVICHCHRALAHSTMELLN